MLCELNVELSHFLLFGRVYLASEEDWGGPGSPEEQSLCGNPTRELSSPL